MPHLSRLSVIGAVCALLVGSPSRAQTIIYVDAGATGPAHDGLTWCTGITELQVALAVARRPESKVGEIRVAQGVYRPDQGDASSSTFELISRVRLRGGFAGCGASNPDARDTVGFESILSGDRNGDDGPDFTNREDNLYYYITIWNPRLWASSSISPMP